jgi:hypothetical protein
MVGSVLLVLAAAAAPTPVPASVSVTPAALQLFERDWVLMNWALKYYDSNLDILLSPTEAQRAADAFRKIADADRDGRVTRQEYRAARELVLAGY